MDVRNKFRPLLWDLNLRGSGILALSGISSISLISQLPQFLEPPACCVSRSNPAAMAGGMDVHKNKYIEDWGTARENLEKTFRFNRRNMTLAFIFGIAVPYFTYQGITGEFNKQDASAEKPPRKFLGSE